MTTHDPREAHVEAKDSTLIERMIESLERDAESSRGGLAYLANVARELRRLAALTPAPAEDVARLVEALREARSTIIDFADKDEIPEGWTVIKQIDAALSTFSRPDEGRE
jgi:hypothetical protein